MEFGSKLRCVSPSQAFFLFYFFFFFNQLIYLITPCSGRLLFPLRYKLLLPSDKTYLLLPENKVKARTEGPFKLRLSVEEHTGEAHNE